MSDVRIRCPKCKWEPLPDSVWNCSCGHQWNTFSTAGRCPACGKIWKDTQCHNPPVGCSQWSPHLEWYDGLDEIVRALIAEIEKKWELVEQEVEKDAGVKR